MHTYLYIFILAAYLFGQDLALKHHGCYKLSSALMEKEIGVDFKITIEKCQQSCSAHEGFDYSILVNGVMCSCTTTLDGQETVEQSLCRRTCMGDANPVNTCGSEQYGDVYSTKADSSSQNQKDDTRKDNIMTFYKPENSVVRINKFRNKAKLIIFDPTVSVQAREGYALSMNYNTRYNQSRHLSFWRPDSADNSSFTYVGGFDYTPQEQGEHKIALSPSQMVSVLKGDVFGIYLDKDTPLFHEQDTDGCKGKQKYLRSFNPKYPFAVGDKVSVVESRICGNPGISIEINPV